MDSILDHDDDEIFVFYNASKEDAVKIRKRQATCHNVKRKLISTFSYLRIYIY